SFPQTSERPVLSSAAPGGRSGCRNSRISIGCRGASMTAASVRVRSFTAYVTLGEDAPLGYARAVQLIIREQPTHGQTPACSDHRVRCRADHGGCGGANL